MINSEEFIIRLRKIMDFHALSASAFADRLGVQRSSISHILSGRNKPSLEFVMKLLSSFEDVDLYWLLNGKGEFPSDSQNSEKKPKPVSKPLKAMAKINEQDIERIIVFFKDGSFKNYSN
ncbi:MAG: helix-turn-helix transcriptional regulator [Bacteroidia bacterium]|nr:helix-turn-helix transcriptional regulator [Bacteroidia bacterium]NND50945.1 helix-turn-helix transcriptional regulator [Flavobacteriaceae bacterium]